MKTKLLFSLMLLVASFNLISCKKDSTPEADPTSVTIDGKEYPAVTIGNQIWMAANYSGAGGVYYDNSTSNTTLGKLYTLAEAKTITPPAGWKLPTVADYKQLFTSQGVVFTGNDVEGVAANTEAAVRKLMSTTEWLGAPGTNASKFNVMASGLYDGAGFVQKGWSGAFWTSSSNGVDPIYFGIIYNSFNPEAKYEPIGGSRKYAVRFVKNK